MSRKYEKVQGLLPVIKEMVEAGKTQREIAEHFGLHDKSVVKGLLNRQRRKEARIAAGVVPNPKGRPRKNVLPGNIVEEQASETRRLKMENELLRDFLSLTGRK
jgi:transposase